MKKCMSFLLASFTLINPIMTVQAANIERPTMELLGQQSEDTEVEPEEVIDNDISEEDSETTDEAASRDSEEPAVSKERETEMSTQAETEIVQTEEEVSTSTLALA